MEMMIRQARTGHWHRKSCIYRKPKRVNYSSGARLVAYLPLPRCRVARKMVGKMAHKIQPIPIKLWRRMLAGGQQSA